MTPAACIVTYVTSRRLFIVNMQIKRLQPISWVIESGPYDEQDSVYSLFGILASDG